MRPGSSAARRRAAALGGALALLAAAAAAVGLPATAQGATASTENRFTLVHGCFGLRSVENGQYVRTDGNGYSATAPNRVAGEQFRMQATDLGKYLLYGTGADFLAIDPTPVTGGIVSDDEASDDADWTVTQVEGNVFRLVNQAQQKQLAVDGSGDLVPAAGTTGPRGQFAFEERSGCAVYPEAETNVSGEPSGGEFLYGETNGSLEAHLHFMAFEFLGGEARCGKPWHKFGAPHALVDCVDHEVGGGCLAVLENFLWGNPPVRCHDTVGWPTFNDWPHHRSLTHEQVYYKWLERAWRAGLRTFVVLYVENRLLCEYYPLKHNSCNEMDSVLLQDRRLEAFEDYVDAQYGGKGEGWFRIVKSPYKARKVINRGKLAVVKGVEISEPFGCINYDPAAQDLPQCDEGDIESWLNRFKKMGVAQMEIVNKSDNALSGVAGDSGGSGALVNTFYASPPPRGTGSFWDFETCEDPDNHDRDPDGDLHYDHNDDSIISNGLEAAPIGGTVPVYPEPPLCNTRGLTELGEFAITEMAERGIIFDPDHMSVKARNEAMDLMEEIGHEGVISSHSWSTPNALPRIFRLGGVLTPYAGGSEGFVHKWQDTKALKDELGRQFFGIGYGADMNGFGGQGGPREGGVTYPFQSPIDPAVTVEKNVSGERVWDFNTDGVAHYGMYADWTEDLRVLAGDEIIEDLRRGSEAYLQMWERAIGIENVQCGGWESRDFAPGGLGDRIRLNSNPKPALKRAGQPEDRTRTWTWCADADDDDQRVKAVFDPKRKNVGMILSNLRKHEIGRARPGHPKRRLPDDARKVGRGLFVVTGGESRRGGRYFYVVRGGRVAATGLALDEITDRPNKLRRYVDRADIA